MKRSKTRKMVEDMVRERGLTKTGEEIEEMVDILSTNQDDWDSVMDHLKSIPKPKPGENELVDHYEEKDEKGNLKNDLWADLKAMNTNTKGECKCIQCDKVYMYDDSGCNVCTECMEEMF
jgi:hypothetical protein